MTALTAKRDTTKEQSDQLPGFASRFYAICSALEMKKFGRTRFLTTITDLSWSGAKACLDDDRAPKKKDALTMMSNELSKLLRQKTSLRVKPSEVESYLVSGSGPLEESMHIYLDQDDDGLVKWDISTIPSAFSGRVSIMIHREANEIGIDIYTDLERQQLELMMRKMTVYCFHHSDIDSMEDDQNILTLIRSMITVAHAKLQ
ncbi:hypothetical protein [Alteromonas macleodii]|uniref:PilZ domain-containing protein n=1 Tax=Alteromonas macleodii TaxID=28108 RepID=A0AB36FNC0_ALTMA|nr:hypothetical protein [Alteromonas macleodii]OES24625.1 hypothetical protein BFV93_4714 [Alteromonas macleodii]OES25377.1 hypothetical protein BFV94_4425 [Alteromonas macleodii]OES25386.1 hypothetical protein BFV95_4415 [Alteromonas macleodii]OES38691.1 hypothetical protein BFV96_4802 [Alteromonas macleodii]